ncbi:hypothetical protein Q5H92_14950 [Hymenobacter sp. M29]|uniref:Restriction endonuclease type IV Mrr domain-containing protein n=1 Tax=Hymenobacter mellowenesis TaxID=3063995 RepID=A0ABT9ACT8_9BACT|nr:hypothetical protein [Hymenobacter sp. M29]MDO7847665.1 hypothetical protein [Hymenobacter sp. M29]
MTCHTKPLFHPPEARFKELGNRGQSWENRVLSLFQTSGWTDIQVSPKDGEWDRKKVDIIPTTPNSPFPFHVQCKSSVNYQKINYPSILASMPKDPTKVNLIAHQRLKEDGSKGGEYVILKLQDFLYLTQQDPF